MDLISRDPAGGRVSSPDEAAAVELDRTDPLPTLRGQFHIPPDPSGGHPDAAYFAGNSLGLQPKRLREHLAAELDDWARLGVEGHVEAERPWVSYHELLREPAARLVGAQPAEVVVMNSLTVNLHLMMVSFYRPTAQRYAIVIEDNTFPSDSYAVRSQAAFHGYDPETAIIRLKARPGEAALRSEDVVQFLATQGENVALVLLGAVNYYSGEFLDIEAITAAGHAAGAIVGWDLAHAAGNVPLQLHDWDVDWAAWCSYKYLNSGPGSLAGAFVHSKHLADRTLPKFAGWWSTDPGTRFQMAAEVTAVDTADSWQLSNPPILALAPVLASMQMFDEVGLDALRAKSVRLTAYLEALVDQICAGLPVEIITPRQPERRGAQLSVRIRGIEAGAVSDQLRHRHGVFADARQPDVIRLAPAPMYCTFHDCWRAATALAEVLAGHG
ncbi:MAG: kynureninase [Jatrophihabitantaceae bacterium]